MAKFIFNSRKGSTTIEAVLVVSALIMSLSVLVFSFILLYQQVLLSRTASFVAQEAAQLWVKDNGLYYRLFDDDILDGNQDYSYTSHGWVEVNELPHEEGNFYQNKFTEIRALAVACLNKALRKPETTTIRIHYDNNLLSRRITVTLSQELSIPLGNIKEFFDDKDTITLAGTGSAVITDPVGYIRNIDLALEYGSKVKEAVNIDAIIEKLKKGVRK